MANSARLLGLLALLCALVGCGVRGAGGTTSRSAARAPAANRRAAQRDAERLLSLPQLPSGSVRLAAEPSGDGGVLRRPPEGSTGLLVDRFRWWRSTCAFAAVVAFLRTHPPPGSHFSQSGHSGGPGVPASQMLGFTLPPVRGVIFSRTLLLNVVALRGGGSGIRVDAQDIWLEPRPVSERVPAGVGEIDITSALPGKPPTVSRHVTAPSDVRTIVGWIDRMQIVQPFGAMSCPAFIYPAPVVTFNFRAAGGGPLLAKARLIDYGFSSFACNPVTFAIRGHTEKPLLGGDFLARVQRLLGVRFR